MARNLLILSLGMGGAGTFFCVGIIFHVGCKNYEDSVKATSKGTFYFVVSKNMLTFA